METEGVASQLWTAVEHERLSRGWTGVKMAEHIGLPRNTIGRLRTSLHKPQVATVHQIADMLGIDREEAEALAGLRKPAPQSAAGGVTVRDAILCDPTYTDEQRETMLRLVDLIDQANQRANG